MSYIGKYVRKEKFSSPIVAYRAWQFHGSTLESLNNDLWQPGKPIRASCVLKDPEHEAPAEGCSCGIYAVKRPDAFSAVVHIYGEVYLWGEVIEHELGYRAEYAYPKTFVVYPRESTVLGESRLLEDEIEARIGQLTAYGVDVLVVDDPTSRDTVPIWRPGSGYTMPPTLVWAYLNRLSWWQIEPLVNHGRVPGGIRPPRDRELLGHLRRSPRRP